MNIPFIKQNNNGGWIAAAAVGVIAAGAGAYYFFTTRAAQARQALADAAEKKEHALDYLHVKEHPRKKHKTDLHELHAITPAL